MPALLASAIAMTCPALSPAAELSDVASHETDTLFVNKVWRVQTSSGVAVGTLYVFLSDGTLLITSPHATPALGSWAFSDGALTMVEDSIAYKVDILKLNRRTFVIRSHNPGEPVDISLRRVPAPRQHTERHR